MKKNGKSRIAIVGAGPGGLTAAMVLAKRGFQVDVFERSPVVGGRNAELRLGDFRFDVGPTFLMMKFVLDKVFEEAGVQSDEVLSFRRLDPMYRLIFPEFSLDVTENRDQMRSEIARCFPGEEKGLDLFLAREAKRFSHIYGCLEKDYSSVKQFFTLDFLRAIPHIPLGRSLFQYLGNYFKPEKLRLCFTFQSKYLGMSPWECPGFFAILPYVEHAYGIFHVQGGLSEISRAMAQVAEKNGARIHLSTSVKQVILDGRRVTGLELADGSRIEAEATILNADFAHAMRSLIPEGTLRKYTPDKLERKKFSCSTFMMYLGLNRTYPDMPHHSIVFARNYRENTEDIFRELQLSDDLSFYIRNSSVTDPHVAPAGKSAVYILVPVPNTQSGIDWGMEKTRLREHVLNLIAQRTPMGDLRPYIEAERLITPADWEASGVFRGATFNLSHSMDQMLYFRPHNEFEELESCYLVGGGTHPGSGLPTIYQSGLIAANLIAGKYGRSTDGNIAIGRLGQKDAEA